MKIFEFIEKYCKDLIEENRIKRELIDLEGFAHDLVITDSEGKKIPVVLIDGREVPVSDFLTLDRSDFLAAWKLPNAAEIFDNYISAIEILEGEDAVYRIRKSIEAEREYLQQGIELVTEL